MRRCQKEGSVLRLGISVNCPEEGRQGQGQAVIGKAAAIHFSWDRDCVVFVACAVTLFILLYDGLTVTLSDVHAL